MRVVAPGKVVLLGEYAVLDGAPALVMAVDRGVSCERTEADTLRIEVPGGDDRFVRAALAAVAAPPAHYRFFATRPLAGPKPGLGSSASATVCAVVAGRGTAEGAFETALAVHRLVQGSGSGIDVAASVHGGLLRYQLDGPLGHATAIPELPPLWPSVIFSGQSAATGPRVQQYLAHAGRAAFVSESRALVDAFVRAPVQTLAEAARLLRSMAERAGIDYWTAGIDQLVGLAQAHGGAAKPSGAGGGDIVVALFPDDAARGTFEAAAQAAGFQVIDVNVAAGVSVAR